MGSHYHSSQDYKPEESCYCQQSQYQ